MIEEAAVRQGSNNDGSSESDRRGAMQARLRRATEQSRRAQELRSDLRAVAAHEMRTPLGTLMGSLNTLAAQWERLTDADRRELVEIARRAAHRLGDVTETLMTMTDAATNLGASPTPVPLRELLQEVLGDLDIVDVDVSCPKGIVVEATPGHLAQIVTNLVINARRYGQPPVVVAAVQEGRVVTITVSDEGPGVPEDLTGRMFDRYERGSDDAESHGLGLAIVRALAEANGGTIEYRPGVPRGARFVVTLPAVA